jgi:hypothetical protein
MINPASSFQYYYLKNLWADIQTAVDANVHLINLFTEPVATSTIIDKFFPGMQIGQNPSAEQHYDLQTSHARLWGKDSRYIHTHDEIMVQLGEFIHNYKRPKV